jgi:serine/threonine protein kinase
MLPSDTTGDIAQASDYVGRNLGGYRILSMLGAGGMGTVFHAQDLNLERDVALKVIAPELARNPVLMNRFKVEAIAQAKLNHKSVVTIHTFCRDDTFLEKRPIYYFVMEYVDGTTLKAWIVDNGPMPVGQGLQVFSQILDGIGYAHSKGVIHRDIKPANIFLDVHHTAKIGDFGIAKVGGIDGLTRVGSGLGSPMYSAPEQLMGQSADERSDIYSLGMTLYEMLAGTPPVRIGETSGTAGCSRGAAGATGLTPARSTDVNPAIPADVDAVIMKSIATDPAQRYQTVKEFKQAIEALVPAGTPDAPRRKPLAGAVARLNVPASVLTLPPRQTLRWIATGLGLVLLAVVGYLAISVTRHSQRPATALGSQDVHPGVPRPQAEPPASSAGASQPTLAPTAPAAPAPAPRALVVATPSVSDVLAQMQRLIARKEYKRAIALGKGVPNAGPLAGDVLQLMALAYFCDGREEQSDLYVDKALAQAGALSVDLQFETPQKRYVSGTLNVTRRELSFRTSLTAAPLLALPLASIKEVSDDWHGDISDLFKKKRNRRMPILVVKSRQGPHYRLQLEENDGSLRKFVKHVINTLRRS